MVFRRRTNRRSGTAPSKGEFSGVRSGTKRERIEEGGVEKRTVRSRGRSGERRGVHGSLYGRGSGKDVVGGACEGNCRFSLGFN